MGRKIKATAHLLNPSALSAVNGIAGAPGPPLFTMMLPLDVVLAATGTLNKASEYVLVELGAV